MKIVKQLLFLTLVVFLWSSVAAADEKGSQATTPGPNVVSQAKYPLNVGSGEYDLITRIQEFPAGAGVANHMHGGHVLVTVLSGEMTLREKGTEKIVKAGESWTESPGNVHSIANAGTATARVVAVFLVPKGAEIITMVK
jgi:quercetin dioxygenase-like cupin family protein